MTDGKLSSGQQLLPEQTLVSVGGHARLHYQGDGNLVVYLDGVPFWASQTHGKSAAHAKMRQDGNFVVSGTEGPVAHSDTQNHPGAMIQLQDDGNFVVYENPNGPLAGTPIWASQSGSLSQDVSNVKPEPVPTPQPGPVRQLKGPTKTIGRSFGDDDGPRIFHGCSWFPALCIYQQDRDEFMRQMDRIAAHQQYVRILWRLNGWHWSGDSTHPNANLTVDPIRDGWFEGALRGTLQAAKDRGVRVNLSSGDMFNWSQSDMEHWFRRVAEISRGCDQHTVWLSAITNEMRGTWQETDENIQFGQHLLEIVRSVYPWNHRAISDPGSQDGAGIKRLNPSPANVGLIHNTRWMGDGDRSSAHPIRRAFNIGYEGAVGMPLVEDEPTGPNGSYTGDFSRKVYQPYERPEDLFPIYTMHVIAGSASTYFNDPALLTRQPLDSTWGFRELPALWRQMGIPEDVGQGKLVPGHKGDAPIRIGSGADRCDSVVCPGGRVAFGIVSGGSNWNVPSGWDAEATLFKADGSETTKHVSEGETLVQTTGKHDPVVVRLTR